MYCIFIECLYLISIIQVLEKVIVALVVKVIYLQLFSFDKMMPFVCPNCCLLFVTADIMLLIFQELQQLKQWEQSTEQMMLEREQLLNSIGSKRTVNLDRLAEMRRKVSAFSD